MKINKSSDILLNVFIPLLLGCFIYIFAGNTAIPLFIKNYLPDGLWAYSFISAILILWNRKFNSFWVIMTFSLAACYELLQYMHWIGGTGDIIDMLIYLTFFGTGLLSNKFFKQNWSIKST